MTAAALLACNRALHDGMGDLQHIAELDVLCERCVVYMGRVADEAVLVVLLERMQLLCRLLELRTIPKYARLKPHGIDHCVADLGHGAVVHVRTRGHLVEAILPLCAACRERILTALVSMLLRVGSGTLAGGLAEDQNLGEAVCAEAVRAVHGDAARLTCRVDAGDARCARMEVRHFEPAHRVVAGRADEHGGLRDVNAREAER